MSKALKNEVLEDQILAKATLNVAERLGLSSAQMTEITGISGSSFTRMKKGQFVEDPLKRNMAISFIRLYRSLAAIVGSDTTNLRSWFDSKNDHLSGIPRELVKSPEGLFNVLRYVDGMRGKI